MAKNLTDLTARTATADTDLLHINSGGTDYKETKANFLIDLPRRFYPNTSSDLRAQIKAKIDEIGTTVSLYGIIGSYNHQTETGTPINNNFYFEALSSGTTNVKLVITIIGASGRKWESYYSSGAWGEWQEVPWVGSFNKQWENNVAITTQVDSIGSSVGTYFGYVSVGSSSVQTTLGLPLATSGLIEARPYNDNYKRIIYTPNGSTRKFVLIKSGGTWSNTWIEEPTRSEINALENEVKPLLLTITAGSSASLTIANNTHAVIVCTGTASTRMGMWIIQATNSGTIANLPIGTIGSNIGVTTSTNTMTFANTATGNYNLYVSAIVFTGSVSASA